MTKTEYQNIVENYQSAVLTLLIRLTGNRAVAEDLTQDVFLRFWKMNPVLDLERHIFTLIYRIANNAGIDYLRKRKEQTMGTIPETAVVSFPGMEDEPILEMVVACLDYLKPKQRAVFVLRDLEGLMFNEIAEILSSAENNLRSNLHLARKKIRKILEERFKMEESDFYDV